MLTGAPSRSNMKQNREAQRRCGNSQRRTLPAPHDVEVNWPRRVQQNLFCDRPKLVGGRASEAEAARGARRCSCAVHTGVHFFNTSSRIHKTKQPKPQKCPPRASGTSAESTRTRKKNRHAFAQMQSVWLCEGWCQQGTRIQGDRRG
jgi:hypothetical protein